MRQLMIDIPLDPNGLPVGPSKTDLVLICPSHRKPDAWRDGTRLSFLLSYGVNGTWGLGGRPDHLEHRRMNEFVRPGNALAFADACGVEAAPGIVLYKGCPKENFRFRHRKRVNAAWLVGPHGQAFFLVQAVDAFAIYQPAFATQFDPDPRVAPTNVHAGQFPNPHAK